MLDKIDTVDLIFLYMFVSSDEVLAGNRFTLSVVVFVVLQLSCCWLPILITLKQALEVLHTKVTLLSCRLAKVVSLLVVLSDFLAEAARLIFHATILD